MNPSESFGFAEATASGVDTSLSVPFINNAELILGSPNTDLGYSGIGESNPYQSGGQSAAASAGPGSGGANTGSGSTSGALTSAASMSGQSAIIWVSVAGIVVAVLLAFHAH